MSVSTKKKFSIIFVKNAHFYLSMCKKKYTFAQNFDN